MIQTSRVRVPAPILALALTLGCLSSLPVNACTIFVLTDTNRTLFCNNEDCNELKHRIWFSPPGRKKHGCAFVGQATDQWAQGGLNSQGLAFDWVAGSNEKWAERNQHKKTPRGNPAERMLERCSTVEEAFAFFQNYKEPGFAYARMLVADRSGASAILGAKNGRLELERETCSRGFGYGQKSLAIMLPGHPEPTLTNAGSILWACRQGAGTRYSNVFDLKSGEIFIFCFPDQPDPARLVMAEELGKGRHYYDMRLIRDQVGQKPKRPSRLKEWAKNLVCWLRWNG